uniref:Uncharacterized protein n=1 Tax=Rhizophora mucronata TaxID=61149 RepID=A0A2P2KDW6_RHIMU
MIVGINEAQGCASLVFSAFSTECFFSSMLIYIHQIFPSLCLCAIIR